MSKIIGQAPLLKEVDKIFSIFTASGCKIRPHFILTGASGTGKSMTVRSLALQHKLAYLEINAAQLTQEGTSGNSLSKALSPLLQLGNTPCVVFVDEFDKLFINGNSNTTFAHETTTGVQNEFLRVVESDTAHVFGDYGKYITVPVNNILFVFGGAFNGEADITVDRLRELGVKTEFLGRVGLVYNTSPLSLEDLFSILEESPLLKTYSNLFEDVDIEMAILTIKGHLKRNFELNTLGARIVNTLIHKYFITGGKLDDKDVKPSVFTRKLTFD